MGTSKGYIAPTKPEWTSAKRAVSSFLRNRDSDSKANAVKKYAEAMSSDGMISSNSFTSAAGKVLGFASGINQNGVDNTLHHLGRDDLIGKDPEYIMNELLDEFTNNQATLEDSVAAEALSQAFEDLDINNVEDFGNINLDILLKQLITEFININFDLRFEEKIGKGRTPAEKTSILGEMHNYIADTLHDSLSKKELQHINLSNIGASKIVKDTLEEALSVCANYYEELS